MASYQFQTPDSTSGLHGIVPWLRQRHLADIFHKKPKNILDFLCLFSCLRGKCLSG